MGRRRQHPGLRISHLVGAVVVSAFVLALSMFPGEYALMMVSVAGLLMIGSCIVVAIVHGARDRRSRRSGLERRKAADRLSTSP